MATGISRDRHGRRCNFPDGIWGVAPAEVGAGAVVDVIVAFMIVSACGGMSSAERLERRLYVAVERFRCRRRIGVPGDAGEQLSHGTIRLEG